MRHGPGNEGFGALLRAARRHMGVGAERHQIAGSTVPMVPCPTGRAVAPWMVMTVFSITILQQPLDNRRRAAQHQGAVQLVFVDLDVQPVRMGLEMRVGPAQDDVGERRHAGEHRVRRDDRGRRRGGEQGTGRRDAGMGNSANRAPLQHRRGS